VTGLDEPTERAWRVVSDGLPEIEFVDRDVLFRDGLTILLVEAATYHRRWAGEFPEKYGADVLGHIRRGLAVLAVDFEEALRRRPGLRAAADRAMDGIDAMLLPATAIVAPLVGARGQGREPLARLHPPVHT